MSGFDLQVGEALGVSARRVGQLQKESLDGLRDRCGEELRHILSV